jgi:hypothetical protein
MNRDKKLTDFKSEELEKEINGSFLIHQAIKQNNDNFFKEYNLLNYEINLIDKNKSHPLHLLLDDYYDKNKVIDILENKCAKNIPWLNKNKDDKTIIELILENNKIFGQIKKPLLDLLKPNLLNQQDELNYLALSNLDSDNLNDLMKKVKINFDLPKTKPAIFGIIENPHIPNFISFLKDLKLKDYDIKDKFGNNILFHYLNSIITNKNLNFEKNNIKKNIFGLLDLGVNGDFLNPINGAQIFRGIILHQEKLGFNQNDLFKYFRIVNPNLTNSNGDNLGHFIINYHQQKNLSPNKLFVDILKNLDDFNQINLWGESVWFYLLQLDLSLDILKEFKKKPINLLQKNYQGTSVNDLIDNLDNDEIKKFYQNLDKIKDKDVKLIQGEFSHSTYFRARFDDILLYFHLLENKYKNLIVPRFNNLSLSQSINFDGNTINLPTNLDITFYDIPYFISYQNDDTYFINPYLNLIINQIKNDGEKDYAIVFLSLSDESKNLHANILLYDFKNNRIERFEPYGNTKIIENNLDNILEEELTWNTGFSYYRNTCPFTGIQSLSDETNSLNEKPGDFGGFCLAWCLWYVEMRLHNPELQPKKLIETSIKKIINDNKSPAILNYIRNFGNKLAQEKYKIYQKLKIPKETWSNLIFDDETNEKIENFIKSLNQ